MNQDYYNEMFALLSTIAVFSDDKHYAKMAEELVCEIRDKEKSNEN